MTAMTALELIQVREALRTRLAELDGIKATCDHCEFFSFPPRCSKFNAAPPEDFRHAEGQCNEWRFNGIPF